MAVVKCKPTSPGRRHVVKVVNPELHKGKPFAPLLEKTANPVVVTTMAVSHSSYRWWPQAGLPYC
ncbi:50S ribosomal protein L2 [Escherichia coli]|nr:50S ribosomal protein L2 [Escherichia coli]